MSLERKDVRAKLDADMHQALTVLCEVDRIDLGEFVERELIRVIRTRVHEASVIAAGTAHLGKVGNRRESQGITGSGSAAKVRR